MDLKPFKRNGWKIYWTALDIEKLVRKTGWEPVNLDVVLEDKSLLPHISIEEECPDSKEFIIDYEHKIIIASKEV